MNIPKPFYGVRVIAFDIFGTILASDKVDAPARAGTINLLERCVNNGIEICSCSDADISDLETQLPVAGISLNYFNKFFEMTRGEEKNIAEITNYYGSTYAFKPEEILVIGDREHIDIAPAQKLRCQTLLVPEYRISQPDNFDFSKIGIKR